MRHHSLLVLLLVVFLGGCMSLSSYQTAQVLEEGTSQFVGAMTMTSSKADTPQGVLYYETDVTYPAPELMFRHAPAKHLEFGIKTFGPFVGVLADIKYQFIDGETWDMAVDLGASYTEVEISSSGTSDKSTKFLDLYPALLMTYHVSDAFSITLAPKVISRSITQTGEPNKDHTVSGATLTLALGEKTKIYPEIGYYRWGDNVDFIHYGIGFGFNF